MPAFQHTSIIQQCVASSRPLSNELTSSCFPFVPAQRPKMKDPRLLLPLILLPPALAGDHGSDFGTINLLGQHSEHERITRAALACQGSWPSDGSCFEPLSIDQLAGKNGTFGAVGAPDVPMPFGAEAHCDDADFLAVENYPHSRREASAKLEACVGYLRESFKEGIEDAEDLLNGGGEVKSFLFYDFGNKMLDTGCAFRPTAPLKTLHKGRAKCEYRSSRRI